MHNECHKIYLSGPFGIFCLNVILTISYLRAQTIETSSLPTDSSRPLFKQIEIFSIWWAPVSNDPVIDFFIWVDFEFFFSVKLFAFFIYIMHLVMIVQYHRKLPSSGSRILATLPLAVAYVISCMALSEQKLDGQAGEWVSFITSGNGSVAPLWFSCPTSV